MTLYTNALMGRNISLYLKLGYVEKHDVPIRLVGLYDCRYGKGSLALK